MKPRRVAITGVGLVTPFGNDCGQSWHGLAAGRSAVRWLSSDVLKQTPWQIPDQITGQIQSQFLGQAQADFGAPVSGFHDSVSGRLIEFARCAAREAVRQSGISAEKLQAAACVIGTSKLDMNLFDSLKPAQEQTDPFPDFLKVVSPASAAVAVSQDWNCQAGVLAPVAACATGLVSLARGAELIQSGTCPVVLAGSSDSSLHPIYLASYKRLGVHARAGDDPAQACRPFDKSRQGFAVGEGAGILVLEDWESACERQATIYAEWLGARVGSDPSGLTLVNDSGQCMTEIVQRLLKDLELTTTDIDCVSLHGTATKLNDRSEAVAMQTLFAGGQKQVPAFGIKGALGHLMGAAGSVETAVSVLSLCRQQVLPTCNHHEPDAPLAVRLFSEAVPMPMNHLLKVSLGFGGHVAAGILKRVERSH